MQTNLSFAEEALRLLAAEAAKHYHQIARCLVDTPGLFIVDRERLRVSCDGAVIRIARDDPTDKVALQVRIASADLVRMIDGTVMMETLLAAERLFILGDENTLLRIAEAVSIFLDGALKLRRFSVLFERYRAWVAEAHPAK